MGGIMTSETTPQLRTATKLWICVDPNEKTIVTNKTIFDDKTASKRTYTEDDFAEQLVTAAIEERLK